MRAKYEHIVTNKFYSGHSEDIYQQPAKLITVFNLHIKETKYNATH